MPYEKTLAIIKPNAVKKRVIGEIIARYERENLGIAALKMAHIDSKTAREFYAEHQGKPKRQ